MSINEFLSKCLLAVIVAVKRSSEEDEGEEPDNEDYDNKFPHVQHYSHLEIYLNVLLPFGDTQKAREAVLVAFLARELFSFLSCDFTEMTSLVNKTVLGDPS